MRFLYLSVMKHWCLVCWCLEKDSEVRGMGWLKDVAWGEEYVGKGKSSQTVSEQDEERGRDRRTESFEPQHSSSEGSMPGRRTFSAKRARLWFPFLYRLTPGLSISELRVHFVHAVQVPRRTPNYSDRRNRYNHEALKKKYFNILCIHMFFSIQLWSICLN